MDGWVGDTAFSKLPRRLMNDDYMYIFITKITYINQLYLFLSLVIYLFPLTPCLLAMQHIS